MSNGDPIGADEPRGKSRAERKGRYDGSYTGTEQRTKDRLMQQFRRTGEGPGAPSDAYRNASCWCACGRLRVDGTVACRRCWEELASQHWMTPNERSTYEAFVRATGSPPIRRPDAD